MAENQIRLETRFYYYTKLLWLFEAHAGWQLCQHDS